MNLPLLRETEVVPNRPPAVGALPIAVCVRADDELYEAGVRACVKAAGDLALVPADRAEVCLVVAKVLDVDLLGELSSIGSGGEQRVVLIVNQFDRTCLAELLGFGSFAILPHGGTTAGQLEVAVRLVASGGSHIPSTVLRTLLAQLKQLNVAVLEPQGLSLGGVTARESELLNLIADGLETKEIAAKLNFSEGTIKADLRLIMRKHRARNRAQLVANALRLGLI